jgi:hypothetical protein
MDIIQSPYRTPSFVNTFLHSILFHFILLSMLFSIPLYSGGASYGSSRGYSVYLSNGDPAVRGGQPQKASVPRIENPVGPSGKSTVPFEGHVQSNAPRVDKEETPLKEQEGRGSEGVEAPVVQELLTAQSPGRTDQNLVLEENAGKQEAFRSEKMTLTVSSNKDEVVEKADMSEKSSPVVQNASGEKTATDSAQKKKSETKPDISTKKTPSAKDNKTVISSGQRGQTNEVTRGKIPIPARKHIEPERELATQAIMPPTGSREDEKQDLQQKAVTVPPLPLSTAPETGNKVTLPSGPKKITSVRLPDVSLTPEPNLSVSEEKPLQSASHQGLSPEITLAAAEEKAYSQVSEKVGTNSPQALQAKDAGKNDTPKAAPTITKQNAEITAGKIELPKAITISGEARVKKKAKSGEGEEDLLKRDYSPVKGNDKTPVVKNSQPGIRAAQTSSPTGPSGSDSKTGRKNDAGLDNPVEGSPARSRQKPGESSESLNDPFKQAHGSFAKSVESGSQKTAMGLKAEGEKSLSPARLAGSETDKNHSAMHLSSRLSGQLAPVLGGAAERPSAGTEVKSPITRAAGWSPPNVGGAATKFESDTKSQAQSDEGKTTSLKSTVSSDPGKEMEKSRVGIPVSEALIQKDIKIKLVLESADMPAVLTQLFRKSHPGVRGRRDREKQETVEGTVETRVPEGTAKTGTRLLVVTKAEKGVYTLVLENKGKKAMTVGVSFRFYEGRDKERGKEYKGREILPGDRLRVVFLMPEALFWDDEDRFSGSVEDSRSITKFNYESGLIWKEEK